MGWLYQEPQSNTKLISYAQTAEMQPFLNWDIVVLEDIICMRLWYSQNTSVMCESREKRRTQRKTSQQKICGMVLVCGSEPKDTVLWGDCRVGR